MAYRTVFSLAFDGMESQDQSCVARLAKDRGWAVEWVEMSDGVARQSLESIVRFLDEPLENPIHVGTYLLARRAKDLDIRTVLTGDGADEFFLGYERHGCWFGERPIGEYRSWLETLRQDMVDELYTSDALRNRREPVTAYGDSCAAFQSLAQALAFERRERLPEYHCMRLDRATMACSVEARPPLLDHRIVEAALSYPARAHRLPTPKHLLKAIGAYPLPDYVVERRKAHFPSWPDECKCSPNPVG